MRELCERFPGLQDVPRLDLGVQPTPVQEFRIDGLSVAVKREDLCHPAYGSSKTRALEFALAGARRRVLTFSTLFAHHAYATALHAAAAGLETDVVLLRRGRKDRLFDALQGQARRVVVARTTPGLLAAAAALWRPGTRVVPPGSASPRGAVGTIEAVLELARAPRRLYVALGTGATVSGILAGLMLRSATTEVVAVRVGARIAARPSLLWGRAHRALTRLRRFDDRVPRASPGGVCLRVASPDGSYGDETPAVQAALDAAGRAGLHLEPAYTGQAMARLLRDRPEGALFWHTYDGRPLVVVP